MKQNEKLKKIRTALELSQADFAEKLGIKQAYYSEMERGVKGVSKKVSTILISNFKVSEKWWALEEGDIFSVKNAIISGIEYMKTSGGLVKKTGLHYQNKWNEQLGKEAPEVKKLISDVLEILSLENILYALEASDLGAAGGEWDLHLYPAKNYNEFKEYWNTYYSSLLMHQRPFKEFAEAVRRFKNELNRIKDDINLEYDFE